MLYFWGKLVAVWTKKDFDLEILVKWKIFHYYYYYLFFSATLLCCNNGFQLHVRNSMLICFFCHQYNTSCKEDSGTDRQYCFQAGSIKFSFILKSQTRNCAVSKLTEALEKMSSGVSKLKLLWDRNGCVFYKEMYLALGLFTQLRTADNLVSDYSACNEKLTSHNDEEILC